MFTKILIANHGEIGCRVSLSSGRHHFTAHSLPDLRFNPI